MNIAISNTRIREKLRARAPLAACLTICFATLSSIAPAHAQGVSPTGSQTAPLNVSKGRYVGEPATTTLAIKAEPSAPVETPPPTIPATFEQSIGALIAKSIKSSRTGNTKGEADALSAFYAKPSPTLMWVTKDGLTDSATQVITELQNAAAFGLQPSAYKTPKPLTGAGSIEELATTERIISQSILRYARHAKGGRVRVGTLGSQLTQAPKLLDPAKTLVAFQASSDRAEALRRLHPQHPQFAMLRGKLQELRGGPDDKNKPKLPAGPTLRKGVEHEQVAMLRTRLGLGTGDNANTFDDTLEAAVKSFQASKGETADGIVGPGTRRALNGGSGNARLITKIKINMERWRWLPENLDGNAGLHVWANIPGLRVRVIKDKAVAFSQKAIVGLVTQKTPVFSDEMEWIEIHPTWFVPNSIKVNDILPSLKRKTSTVMQRYKLKVNCGAHGSNANAIDWNKIDISKCSFSQPAGPKSVLGNFKFKFPNKHSVYMHDTHKRGLFSGKQRTYSHGCIRVMKPRSLAHILLENDSGMTAKQLDRIVDGPQTLNTKKLRNPVPVHITYFTAVFDDDGNFQTRPDYYSHDARLIRALSGRTSDASPTKTAKPTKPTKPKAKIPKKQQDQWWSNLF